jgi:L-asparaginase / beta-aspartyl-peptidase
MAYKQLDVQEACDLLIHEEFKNSKGNIGVIALDKSGNIGIAFNCDRMHRGYKIQGRKPMVKIYK